MLFSTRRRGCGGLGIGKSIRTARLQEPAGGSGAECGIFRPALKGLKGMQPHVPADLDCGHGMIQCIEMNSRHIPV